MSELTQCNFCSLQEIKAKAKAAGDTITVMADGQTSKNVYVHPKSVNVRTISDQQREKYFVSWMEDLTPECCC